MHDFKEKIDLLLENFSINLADWMSDVAARYRQYKLTLLDQARLHPWLLPGIFAVMVVPLCVALGVYLLGGLRVGSSSSVQMIAPTVQPSVTAIASILIPGTIGTNGAQPSPTIISVTSIASPTPTLTPSPGLVASAMLASPTSPSVDPCPGVVAVSGVPPFPSTDLEQILEPVGYFGVVVFDMNLNRIIYTCHADDRFYAASLIKVPIAITLLHAVDHGKLSLDETLTTKADDMVEGSGSIQGEPVGRSYTLRDLMRRMIIESDNVAANLLMKRLGFALINEHMAAIGAINTKVERLFFDEKARIEGKTITTSPHDMALLLRELLGSNLLREESSQLLLDAMGRTADDTKIPALLPPEVTVRNKTGEIEGVVHDAGIVELPDGKRYVVVLMSDKLIGNGAGTEAIAQASRLIYNYEIQIR